MRILYESVQATRGRWLNVLERAKRLVEMKDVVILLDSLTRLSREISIIWSRGRGDGYVRRASKAKGAH